MKCKKPKQLGFLKPMKCPKKITFLKVKQAEIFVTIQKNSKFTNLRRFYKFKNCPDRKIIFQILYPEKKFPDPEGLFPENYFPDLGFREIILLIFLIKYKIL